MCGDQKQPGLRERKKRETRALLSWAAIRLTVERGFENVRVEDIAAAAGVSTRTFNNYFASKGEAIAARQLDRALAVAEQLRARPASEPLWTAITQAVLSAFDPGPEVLEHPVADDEAWQQGLRRMMAQPIWTAELMRANATAEAKIAEAVAERTGTDVHTDLYPNLVAGALSAATVAAMQHRLRVASPPPMERLLTGAIAHLAAGLPPPTR